MYLSFFGIFSFFNWKILKKYYIYKNRIIKKKAELQNVVKTKIYIEIKYSQRNRAKSTPEGSGCCTWTRVRNGHHADPLPCEWNGEFQISLNNKIFSKTHSFICIFFLYLSLFSYPSLEFRIWKSGKWVFFSVALKPRIQPVVPLYIAASAATQKPRNLRSNTLWFLFGPSLQISYCFPSNQTQIL